MSARHVSSKPDAWVSPRPPCDASQRMHTYGPLQPMDDEPRWSLFMRAIWLAVAVLFLVPVAVAVIGRLAGHGG